MSKSEPEKMLLNFLELFHQNAGEEDTLDKSKMKKVMKANFSTFLSACEKKNPAFLEEFFKKINENQDKKISFPEFMSCMSQVAEYFHDLSHNQS